MSDSSAQILNVRVVQAGWSRFMVCKVRLPDGAEVTRQIEAHGDAVAVLPYDAQRRTVVLVRLLRVPALYAGGDGVLIEAVAGIIDSGETAPESARREGLEEVGLALQTLEPVATVWSSPGISTETIALYLAPYEASARVAQGGGAEGEHEGITVLELPIADAYALLDQGDIKDMKTLALMFALRLSHPELFGTA